MTSPLLTQEFGHKVRLRVCGILKEEGCILLLNHKGLGKAGFLWSPPGGGVQFGESVKETLRREFREETGLEVEVTDFLFFHEHISETLHAVELFFRVLQTGGNLQLGYDPELSVENQILSAIRFWGLEEIQNLPENQFHARILEM